MPGIFSTLFGGNNGIVHNGVQSSVTQLPQGNAQQNLQSPNGGNVNQQQAGSGQQPEQKPEDPIGSQLDNLRAIWNNPTNAQGQPVAQQIDPLSQQLFQFDPAKVKEGADKLDFTQGINPELLTKAAGGDVEALRDALNQAVRTGFVGSTLNTGAFLNDGFSRHSKNIDQALPQRLRNFQVSNARSENPILAHDAVKPMVSAMKTMIASKMPNASAEDIQSAAEEYFLRIGQAFMASEKKEETAKAKADSGEDVDWLKQMGL